MKEVITKFKNLPKGKQLNIIDRFASNYYEGVYFKEYINASILKTWDLEIETINDLIVYKDTTTVFFDGYIIISNDVLIKIFINYISSNESTLYLLRDLMD